MKIRKTGDLRNRVLSFMSAAIISVSTMPVVPYSTAEAVKSANVKSSVNFPEVAVNPEDSAKLNHDDTLVDNGDGTYTFTSKITADYSFSDISESRLKSTDGVYPLDKAGTYLIELWGGDGGDGGEFFPLSFLGGAGGSGGFVYGTLTVSQADVGKKKLVYEIGSKGESETRSITGGGTNGTGGGAGDIAIFSVGAGGGHSAVYLVDSEPDDTLTDIEKNDPSKVLMIAGGGGGGGAGASLHSLNFLSTIFGGEGKANGGDGGYNYNGVLSDTPSIGNFDKNGTNSNYVGKYYAGKNGSTSGTKGAYAGQGGTDKPGEVVKSFIGILENDNYANDWQQIYHPELARGVGGAGNFRGGGGGAGFAGATGGFQNEPIDGRNVGGGGGGSSYIAAGESEGGFTGFTPNDMPTGDQAKYFVDRTGNDNKAVGGAVVIRYMPTGADYSYLEDVTVSGKVSNDFVIDSFECSNSVYNDTTKKFDTTPITDITPDNSKPNEISFSGSVAPVGSGIRQGQEQDYLTITLKLRPTTVFNGGNDVPIFTYDANNMAFDCTSGTKTCKFMESGTASRDFSVSHVNVPYSYPVPTKSIERNVDEAYAKTDLIDSTVIAGYAVDSRFTNPFPDPVADIPDFIANTTKGIHKFNVELYVKPKTLGVNSVGEANAYPTTTLEGKSVANVVNAGRIKVDDYWIVPKKKLEFTDDKYNLSLNMEIDLDEREVFKSFVGTSTVTDYPNDTQSELGTEYTGTLEKGYYFIEVWGADGGNSGIYNGLTGTFPSHKGGNGAHEYGFIKIDDNNTPYTLSLGEKGSRGLDKAWGTDYKTDFGNANSNSRKEGTGGTGGETVFTIGNTLSPILKIVSNGGTGGKPSYRSLSTGDNGEDGVDGTATTTGSKSLSSSLNVDAIDNNSYTAISRIANSGDDDSTVENGAIRITKLAVKPGIVDNSGITYYADTVALSTAISNRKTPYIGYLTDGFTVTEDYSQYFTFDSATANNCTIEEVTPAESQKIKYKLKLSSTDAETALNVEFEEYTGSISEYQSEIASDVYNPPLSLTTYYYSISIPNIGITAKYVSKTGFLGGNDVPLLNVKTLDEIAEYSGGDATYMSDATGTEVYISHSYTTGDSDDDTGYVPRNNATDWANVVIDETAFSVKDDLSGKKIIVPYNSAIDPNDIPECFDYDDSPNPDWIDDFVTFTSVPADTTKKYTEDGICSVVGKLEPVSAPAEKAIVIPSVSEVKKSAQIPVKIRYTVTKELNHIVQNDEAQGVTIAESGSALSSGGDDKFILDEMTGDYVLKLEAADEYDLPGSDPDYPIEDHVHVYYDDGDDETVDVEVTSADIAKKDGYITITIPASAFTQNLRIEAEGVPQTPHYVHYMYAFYDKTAQRVLTKESVQQESGHDKVYHSGDTIVESYPFMPDYSTDPTEFPTGYDNYDWDWPIEKDNSGNYVMGDTDIYVVGTYRPVTYKIRITYESDNAPDTDFDTAIGGVGNKEYTSPDRTEYHDDTNTFDIALTAGTEFYRKSPEVSGYYPDRPVIAFTVDDDFINNIESGTNPLAAIADSQIISGGIDGHKAVEVPVKYTKLAAGENLIINFVKCDIKGNPTGNSSSSAFVIDGAYDEHTTAIENAVNAVLGSENEIYLRTKLVEDSETHIKKETVFDEVKGNSSEGLTTFNVYYRPKLQTVTVKFYDKLGDTETVATKTCVIGREYGYNADTQIYDSMPRAVRSNERLIGWQTEDGEWVTEESMVEGADGDIIKLYGVWEPLDNIINVDYKYAYSIDTNVADPKTPGADIPDKEFDDPPIRSTIVKYGMSYTIPVPTTLTESSYKADKTAVSGVAFGTKTEEVLYSNNSNTTPSVTLTVNIYSNMYEGGTIDNSTPKLTGGTFELWDTEGNRVGPAKKNTDGSVSWTDLDSGITASGDYIIKCIDPPAGFGTAEKEVTLVLSGSSEYTVNIFLDKFPFPLPFAGGKPLTGYTVGGLSTMLLAAFLLFLYVSSKSEEEKENE